MSDKSPRRTRACREEISLSVNNMPIGKYNIWDIRDVEESFHSLCLKESVTTKRQYDFDVKDIEPDLLRCFFDRLKENPRRDDLQASPGLVMAGFNDYESAKLQSFCQALDFLDLLEVVTKWREAHTRTWESILLDMVRPEAIVTLEDEETIIEHMPEILKNDEFRKHLMDVDTARVCRIVSKLKPDTDLYKFLVDYTCVSPEKRACIMWTVTDWDKLPDDDLLRLREDVPKGVKIEVELGEFLQMLRIKRDVLSKMSEVQQAMNAALERARGARKMLDQVKVEEAQHASQ